MERQPTSYRLPWSKLPANLLTVILTLQGGWKQIFGLFFFFGNCSLCLKLPEKETGFWGMESHPGVLALSMLPLNQNKSCEHKCLRKYVLIRKWCIYRTKSLSHETTEKECHPSLCQNQRCFVVFLMLSRGSCPLWFFWVSVCKKFCLLFTMELVLHFEVNKEFVLLDKLLACKLKKSLPHLK